jgi:hypothetical protein
MTTKYAVCRLMLILSLLMSFGAGAGEVKFFVPVSLIGLPSGTQGATLSCYVMNAGEKYGIGGETTVPIIGDRLETILTVFVRRPDDIRIRTGLPHEYYCRIIINGETAEHYPFQFMSGVDVDSEGWNGILQRGVGRYNVVLRPSPSTLVRLFLQGPVPASIIAELESTGSCPCGCGATTGEGSACDSSKFGFDPFERLHFGQDSPPPRLHRGKPATPPLTQIEKLKKDAPNIRLPNSGKSAASIIDTGKSSTTLSTESIVFISDGLMRPSSSR